VLLTACATGGGPRPSGEATTRLDGLKILYEGRSETPKETHRFRLALALASDRLRLEVLAPVGGPRLVVIADGRRLLALDPANRRAEIWDPEPQGIERLLGAAIAASDVRTLLEGRSPCDVRGDAASDDRSCPFGSGRYRPGDPAGPGEARSATLLDASGAPVLALEYPLPPPADGTWWPAIVLRRPGGRATLHLRLVSGPARATLDPALFSTERPDGFETGQVLGSDGLTTAAGGETPGP
jgi:hypothetical protein